MTATFLLALYAGVVTVVMVAALWQGDSALRLCKQYRELTTRLMVELEATKVSALVVSLWERDREETAREAMWS